MENLETKLYELIRDQYGSVSKFAEHISMAQSTIDSILKRGIPNSNVSNAIKICKELQIDIELLAQGQIVKKLKETPLNELKKVAEHAKENASIPATLFDTDIDAIEFLEMYQQLDPRDRGEVKGFTNGLLIAGRREGRYINQKALSFLPTSEEA